MKKFISTKGLVKKITELSDDFMDDYLITEERRQKFIEQVVDYASNTCHTWKEVYSFVDGLLELG